MNQERINQIAIEAAQNITVQFGPPNHTYIFAPYALQKLCTKFLAAYLAEESKEAVAVIDKCDEKFARAIEQEVTDKQQPCPTCAVPKGFCLLSEYEALASELDELKLAVDAAKKQAV